MTDWTTARVTPEMQAELRRLLDANEVPWSAHRPSPNYARYEISDDRGYDLAYTVEDALGGNAEIIVAAVNALPALLDAAAERDRLARLLDEPRRSGCAVEIAGVRIAPCDERGQTADMRALAAAADRLAHMREARDNSRAEVERVRALHQPEVNSTSALFPTPLCGCGDAHPCATIRALDAETGGEPCQICQTDRDKMAQAWDEGADFARRHPFMSSEYIRWANPYRTEETR